ncbi:MAG: hypothetical protein QF398_04120, partial [Alphaproteobacteria bacterium]|nr:hypothetical protein [Alphaproteobacteria bacterium]
LAKWASNNGQIIKSGLPNDRRAKFLPSVVGFAYDLLRYECYLGNIGLEQSPSGDRLQRPPPATAWDSGHGAGFMKKKRPTPAPGLNGPPLDG